jgi:hypothetical protein
MAGGLLNAQPYAPCVIYKSSKLLAEWTEPSFAVVTNGQSVDAFYTVSPSGGMTPAVLMEWVNNIVLPSHPELFLFIEPVVVPCPFGVRPKYIKSWRLKEGVDAVPESMKLLELWDGDPSHIDADFLDYASTFMHFKPPPPYTSSRLQHGDARNGTNQSLKDSTWPSEQGDRSQFLRQHGITRPLDRTDVPRMLKSAYPRAFKPSNNLSALAATGLAPFTQRPKWDPDIMTTKGQPSCTEKKQLDVNKIKFHVDAGKMDDAGEEMAKQLAGSRFSTGKMIAYCATDAAFRLVARVSKERAEKNKAEKAAAHERSVAAAAQRAANKEAAAAQKEAARAQKARDQAARQEEKKRDAKRKLAAAKQKRAERAKKAKTLKQQQAAAGAALAAMSEEERKKAMATLGLQL